MIKRWLRTMIREEVEAALKDRKDNIKVRLDGSRIREIAQSEIAKTLDALCDAAGVSGK